MDLTASILAATGTASPTIQKPDGRDVLPVLSGRAPVFERDLFWRTKGPREQRAVRSGNWKLLWEGPNLYLFDVAADPGEHAHHEEMPVAIADPPDPGRGDEHSGGEERGDQDRALLRHPLGLDEVERQEDDDRRLEVTV